MGCLERSVVAVVGLRGGCEVWKAPDRVKELEGRVNELSSVVSAMAGKQVGARPGEPAASAKPGEAGSDHGGNGAAPAAGGDHDKAAPAAEPGHSGGERAAADAKPAAAEPEHKPTVPEVKHAAHWSYDGKDGPPLWATLDPAWSACDGKMQSPIDIEP